MKVKDNFIMTDIFKIRDLGVCKKVQLSEKTAFTYHELKADELFQSHNLPYNFIIFVLGGMLEIDCNQYESCPIETNQMILLLRASAVRVRALKKTSLFVLYFDALLAACDQQILNAYLPDADKITYQFHPTSIPEPVVLFLRQLNYFQALKMDCVHFHGLKHREFFLLLRTFCPREDIVMFLAPLIGRSLYFRNKVLEKYSQLGGGSVTDLAGLVGMGRKNFDKQFRKEFGTSPAKWMLEEKAKHLFVFLNDPEITIADAMDHFNFNSATHFNRFCMQHYKKTPGKIIKEAHDSKKRKKTVS